MKITNIVVIVLFVFFIGTFISVRQADKNWFLLREKVLKLEEKTLKLEEETLKPKQAIVQNKQFYVADEKGFFEAIQLMRPSMALIKTKKIEIADLISEDLIDKEIPRHSRGAGFFVEYDKKRYIITNWHVIRKAVKNISVVIFGNNNTIIDIREINLKENLVGFDIKTDVALIKTDRNDVSYVKFPEQTQKAKVGEWTLVMGFPTQSQITTTVGIVSSINKYIQTDAAINRGNSGGPIVTPDGKIIGIVSKGYATKFGIGYAIPIEKILTILSQLVKNGYVKRGEIGAEYVEIQSVSEPMLNLALNAKKIILRKERKMGVVILSVKKNGPAEKSGLKEGDIVEEIKGVKIDSSYAFDEAIALLCEIGEPVPIKIKRGESEKEMEFMITIEEEKK